MTGRGKIDNKFRLLPICIPIIRSICYDHPFWQKGHSVATQASLRRAGPALSPAQRAMRLQRIFARMQEGLSYKDIAAEEGVSRERLRQIVRAATTRRDEAPDHRRMQIARLMPALRLLAWDVENGETRAIPSFLKLLDRLDRYCAADRVFLSPPIEDLVVRTGRRVGARRLEAADSLAERAGGDPAQAQALGDVASP
jgi:hypothetical protein